MSHYLYCRMRKTFDITTVRYSTLLLDEERHFCQLGLILASVGDPDLLEERHFQHYRYRMLNFYILCTAVIFIFVL